MRTYSDAQFDVMPGPFRVGIAVAEGLAFGAVGLLTGGLAWLIADTALITLAATGVGFVGAARTYNGWRRRKTGLLADHHKRAPFTRPSLPTRTADRDTIRCSHDGLVCDGETEDHWLERYEECDCPCHLDDEGDLTEGWRP